MTNDRESKLREILDKFFQEYQYSFGSASAENDRKFAYRNALASILELDNPYKKALKYIAEHNWASTTAPEMAKKWINEFCEVAKRALNDKHKHSFVAVDTNEAVCLACGKRQAFDQTGECPLCNGTGVTPDKKPYEGTCPVCDGTGKSQKG